MEQKIIELFKKCIARQEREGRPTRAPNLVGYLAKRTEMRKWFYDQYSSPTDWIHFFHEHPKHFIYDESNGNFKVNHSQYCETE